MYCWAHAKIRARGGPLRPLKRQEPPIEAVIEAGTAWLETPAEAAFSEYRERRNRFLRACERMMLARGWRPPEPADLEQLEHREAPAAPAALGI